MFAVSRAPAAPASRDLEARYEALAPRMPEPSRPNCSIKISLQQVSRDYGRQGRTRYRPDVSGLPEKDSETWLEHPLQDPNRRPRPAVVATARPGLPPRPCATSHGQ